MIETFVIHESCLLLNISVDDNFIDFFIFYKSEKFSQLNSILYKFVKPCCVRRLIVLY